MSRTDPRIDAYIAKSADFAKPILKRLRRIVHDACPGQIDETMKWSMPFFTHNGIVCHMAAFKQHCSFGFWNRQLVLGEKAGNERDGMGQFGRITSIADLPNEKLLAGYLRKAVELNDAGTKTPARSRPKAKKELVVPDYFLAALRKSKKAIATFEGFSYSHKKEYVEWVTEAKREETRQQRLQTAVKWLTDGKPRHWKYAGC